MEELSQRVLAEGPGRPYGSWVSLIADFRDRLEELLEAIPDLQAKLLENCVLAASLWPARPHEEIYRRYLSLCAEKYAFRHLLSADEYAVGCLTDCLPIDMQALSPRQRPAVLLFAHYSSYLPALMALGRRRPGMVFVSRRGAGGTAYRLFTDRLQRWSGYHVANGRTGIGGAIRQRALACVFFDQADFVRPSMNSVYAAGEVSLRFGELLDRILWTERCDVYYVEVVGGVGARVQPVEYVDSPIAAITAGPLRCQLESGVWLWDRIKYLDRLVATQSRYAGE